MCANERKGRFLPGKAGGNPLPALRFACEKEGKVSPMEWEAIEKRLNSLLAAGKHGELRGAMMMLNEVDIAQYMETLDKEKLLLVFRILPKDISADVFSYMSPEQKQTLIASIGDQEICALIDNMFLDDAVDFLEELPAGVVRRVLQSTNAETRNLINQFLRYPENSAGSIMTIEYLEFHEGETVADAMATIRKVGLDKETIYTLYIIDSARRLLGTLALRKMILADNSAVLSDMMDANPVFVHTTDDQEKVADLVRRYDLLAIPVVDTEERLVGIITADDVMDVIEQENTEDFEKMAALTPSEEEYLKTPVLRMAINRIPWLLLLAVIAIFTGMIIQNYESLLSGLGHIGIVLTTCIPMLMDTGGNAGSQASVSIIRGLSLGEIEYKDVGRILWKEARVAFLCGISLAAANFVKLLLIDRVTIPVAIVVCSTLVVTVLAAKLVGCSLPVLAKRIGFDPAVMASPFITTIVDALSLLIYFRIACAVLHIG